MNKKYDPVIDFASFRKWQDEFNRGIKDVVDSDSREKLGKNVGDVLTRSLDAIFEQTGAARPSEWQRTDDEAGSVWKPTANTYQTNEHYVVDVELAGVGIDDIDVEIRGNHLMVSGEREDANRDNRDFQRKERASGFFRREFKLPADCDTDDISAEMENGLLSVRVGLSNSASTRTIKVAVKSGGNGSNG